MRGFAVSLEGVGTKTVGMIRTDEPRALDLTARNGRRVEAVPTMVVEEVVAKLATLLT